MFLREDQKDYQKAVRTLNYQKTKGGKSDKNLFDPDVIPLDAINKLSNVRGPSIGYGRNNRNQSRKKVT